MLKVWRWYQRCLSVHPLKTQVISSGFLWGFGEKHAISPREVSYPPICLPNYELILYDTNKDADFKLNWKRVAITSIFGLGFVGPVGHFWYEGLDKFIKLKLRYVPKSTRFVAAKVAMDGLIFGPIDLLNTSQVKEGLKRDFLPALALEGGAWPLLQIANFRYVPVQYQLLYVNIFCLIDSAFLSWVDQQKDAAWKQWFTTSFLTLKERGGTGGV
ncbi:hypothetical protein Bca4012_055604 [Brassica carinata]|uniref:PXMP2/4 family protein 2 n=1 Tax=Brassica carinata TaxID=52824 RepID=A0A8X7W100_BRACI|nr:hypothetical protein Bca52824_014574 [Brassica carinata]